jgi:hypothetical protein
LVATKPPFYVTGKDSSERCSIARCVRVSS